MAVKQLIEKLKEYDPEAKVITVQSINSYEWDCANNPEIKEANGRVWIN